MTLHQTDTYDSIQKTSAAITESSHWVDALHTELDKKIIGQRHLVGRLLTGMLSGGHILLEGLPGLAKTLTIKTMAEAIQADFKRIQFTPDMLPADIIGTQIYNPQQTTFETKTGPIFASIILADEINRSPAKVQSALLEAMQEKQVTIGESSLPLPELFLVMATQNPIEQEGTYPLPEAQLDRFLFKVVINYPNKSEERQILDRYDYCGDTTPISTVATPEEILKSRQIVRSIYMDEKIADYIIALVQATREPADFNLQLKEYIETGASPRATLGLKTAAKCHAYLAKRGFVTPDDVKDAALDVLRHRVRISYEAEAEGLSSEDIIRKILDTIPVP